MSYSLSFIWGGTLRKTAARLCSKGKVDLLELAAASAAEQFKHWQHKSAWFEARHSYSGRFRCLQTTRQTRANRTANLCYSMKEPKYMPKFSQKDAYCAMRMVQVITDVPGLLYCQDTFKLFAKRNSHSLSSHGASLWKTNRSVG